MTEGIFESTETILKKSIIKSYFNKNNELVKIEKFDKTNKKLKLSEITFKDNGRTPETQIQYEYNKATNKLIKTTTYVNNNNTITIDDNINNTITTETYHSNGKVKERIIKDKKNNIISTRNFNENGICTSATAYDTEGQKTFEREFYEDGKTLEKIINYTDGKKVAENYFREDGKTAEKMINYIDGKKFGESYFREDGKTVEKMINYIDDKKTIEAFYREYGKTVEKMINYRDGKKIKEAYFREDGKTLEKIINYTDGKKVEEIYFRKNSKSAEKMIFYENNEKIIKKIFFYDVNSTVIDVFDGTKLQELLKDLDNNKCDIETLTMSIDEEDNSIKHYSACDETNKNIRYAFTYKDDKKVKTTQIIDENNELQNTLSSVQGASDELPDKEQDDLLQSHLINL